MSMINLLKIKEITDFFILFYYFLHTQLSRGTKMCPTSNYSQLILVLAGYG
jgi:hypothetical protein